MLLLSAYCVQAENVGLDHLLLHGGTAEDNGAAAAVVEKLQGERVLAARARRDYDRAVRSLNKVGDEDACCGLLGDTKVCTLVGVATIVGIA